MKEKGFVVGIRSSLVWLGGRIFHLFRSFLGIAVVVGGKVQNYLRRFWFWFLPRLFRVLGIEYPQAIYLPFPPGDWRQQVLRDFADWLEEIDSAMLPSHPLDLSHDLVEVLTELSALRQELNRQNREHRKAGEQMTTIEELHREVLSQLETRFHELIVLKDGVKRDAEKSVFLLFADLRDSLQRGIKEIEASSQKNRFLWKPPPGLEHFEEGYEMALARFQGYEAALDHFREGYEMALARFDRILSHLGIQRVPTWGHPFDPRVMVAIATHHVPEVEPGVVVEESVSGYVRGEEVIRLAQVIVADESISEVHKEE